MIVRYLLFAGLTILVAIPAWVYVSLAGGETLYERGSLTPGHGGIAIAMLLLLIGLVMILVKRSSPVPIRLAMGGLAIIILTTIATGLMF